MRSALSNYQIADPISNSGDRYGCISDAKRPTAEIFPSTDHCSYQKLIQERKITSTNENEIETTIGEPPLLNAVTDISPSVHPSVCLSVPVLPSRSVIISTKEDNTVTVFTDRQYNLQLKTHLFHMSFPPYSLSGSTWTAFADLGLGANLVGTGICLF